MKASALKEHYKNEAVADSYDRDRFHSFSGSTFDRLEKRAIWRLLAPLSATLQKGKTLDVPCGTGRITEFLLQKGLQVTGGDISEAMIAKASSKCHHFGSQVEFRHLDLDALDLPSNSFQLVTCIRLFHHLATKVRAQILKELARVSSGYVLVNVSYDSAYYRCRRRLKQFMGQGISKCSSSWPELIEESYGAGLRIDRIAFVCRPVSEDLVLLLCKDPVAKLKPGLA